MAKTLVIVESPGKIKKITSILGNNYLVMASVGHVREMYREKLSVDIENGFKPIYKISEGKSNVVRNLKDAVKKCKEVILAADEDREGEAIAASLADILKLKDPKRIVFNSITKNEILNAVKNPRKIDQKMVDAQEARAVLDKIVGYRLCPLLWQNITNGLSAGRVQSAVLRLVIDRENEINEHSAKNYFKTIANFVSVESESKHELKSVMNEKDMEKSSSTKYVKIDSFAKINSEKEIKKLLKLFMDSTFLVKNVFDKKSDRNPSPPFITSSLQQEASYKLGFSPQTTMSVAKKLYEGGHITYLRTDSTNLSKEAINSCKKFIVDKYGQQYHKTRIYKSKSKNAQEAHEAIRPTHFERTSVNDLGNQEKRLYSLIWKRAVASQMSPAKINTTYIQVDIENEDKIVNKYYFETSIEKITFDGFLRVYNVSNVEQDSEENEDDTISSVSKIPKKGDLLEAKEIVSTEEYTKAIGRYTEASLIKEIEKRGIGRPSTFATMVSKIQKKDYVKKKDVPGEKKKAQTITLKGKKITTKTRDVNIGKEKNKLVPEHLGFVVTKYLLENFDNILDYKFTANMENDLDKIANGNLKRLKLLKDFYGPFNTKFEALNQAIPKNTNNSGRYLGDHPETGAKLYAVTTKVGHAVKAVSEDSKKPKYVTIEKPYKVDKITLEEALTLFNKYPKKIGNHDEGLIELHKGKYGFYLTYNGNKYSVDSEKITLNEAIEKVKYPKNLGKHKKKDVVLKNGSKGLYISCNGITCSIKSSEINLEQAIKLLEEKNKSNIKQVKIGRKAYDIKLGKYGPYICYSVGQNKKFVNIPKNIKPEDITAKQITELINKPKKKFVKRT